jgi:hypothetical protein
MSTSNSPNPTGNLQSTRRNPPPAPTGANVTVWNILCDGKLSPPLNVCLKTNHTTSAGPFTIDIAVESSSPHANPSRPQFLKGISYHSDKEEEWSKTVLPYIRLLTFTIASTTDTFFIGNMLKVLPNVSKNVLQIDINGFHWFSGISQNRTKNPYLVLASQLKELKAMAFTLHTAAVTDSLFGERFLLELERTDPERAKQRRVRSVMDVTSRYGMGLMLDNKALERIRLVYIKSDMVAAYTVQGDPEDVLVKIGDWLVEGFRKQGQEVTVQLSRAS